MQLILGDCLEELKKFDDGSIDAIVSDPPYELGFMGKKWDNTGIAYNIELWKECLRVLKPGGHLLAFGGTRTYHRMAVAIEDAGFEVRDMLEWIYASGFPKSRNIGLDVDKLNGVTKNRGKAFVTAGQSGQKDKDTGGDLPAGSNTIGAYRAQNEYNGYGTALKPAHEPIILARKPLSDGGLDIAKTICYNIREKGLITNQNILWRIENVKNVGKQKTKLYSTKIQLPKVVEISAKIVETNENDCVGKQILKLQELMQKSGEKQILSDIVKSEKSHTEQTKKELQNTQKDFNKSESNVSLTLTEENASVAEKQAQSSSLLTISESGEEDTEKNSDTKISTLGSKSKDSQKKDLDCCVGTATLPTLNMEIARIIKIEFENKEYEFAQLTDGSFVWNNNLTPFREPRPCTIVENVLKHGTGALDIDGCRIPISKDDNVIAKNPHTASKGTDAYEQNCYGKYNPTEPTNYADIAENSGRFPANIICTDDALNDGVIEKGGKARKGFPGGKTFGGSEMKAQEGQWFGDTGSKSRYFDIDVWSEKHGLLQFPKASKRERNEGLGCYLTVKYNGSICKEENMVAVQLLQKVISEQELVNFNIDESGVNIMVQCHKDSLYTILTEIKKIIESKTLNLLMHSLTNESIADANSEMENGGSLAESVESLKKFLLTITNGNQELALGASRVVLQMLQLINEEENWKPLTNFHSTVKPVHLVSWLVRLVSKEGDIVLDPFMGSGTTGIACKLQGRDFIGIELNEEYMEIAKARIEAWKPDEQTGLFS